MSRSTEATLSILSITNPALRDHLGAQMRSVPGDDGSFLAPPLFEQTFGWKKANQTMLQLAENEGLLSKEVVCSLDSAGNGGTRFGADWQPFTHQLASWKALLEEKKSVVVTSGTGSGKTECFMVPIIEDLYRELREADNEPLVGVRALFLYPLNALINSQQERLDAWTKQFGEGIRYCLYNGNTPELSGPLRTQQRLHPNEVMSRELMREEPAPLLITNGSMLEYMIVRQIDAPIIQKSKEQKSLRWIVLDEAHTYVGSQAAELALQLRRVMSAFGVTPEDVRFVATSATIAGDDAREELQTFLSHLSGVPTSQVVVLDGSRDVPNLEISKSEEHLLEELEARLSSNKPGDDVNPECFNALAHTSVAREIRDLLVNSDRPLKVTEIQRHINKSKNIKLTQNEVLRWLDLCSGVRPDKDSEPFLKLRAHFYHRTTHGVWSCIDPNCSHKDGTALQDNWPFGNVYATQRYRCDCDAPVLELTFCRDCNEPHLLASDQGGKLVQWEHSVEDEFSLLVDEYDEYDESIIDTESSLASVPLVVAPHSSESESYVLQKVCRTTGAIGVNDDSAISVYQSDGEPMCSNMHCSSSHKNGDMPFRRALLGAPFYITNITPTVLEYCQDFTGDKKKGGIKAQSLPGNGRRLITFTDSRQGTARLTIRMQQEAERNRLRGYVVDILMSNQNRSLANTDSYSEISTNDIKDLIKSEKKRFEQYKNLGLSQKAKEIEKTIVELESELNLDQANSPSKLEEMSWTDVVKELASKDDMSSILIANKNQNSQIFSEHSGTYELADLLLFREFMRRPKHQNSLETQGLIKVDYPDLYKGKNRLPELWVDRGLTEEDWLDFLKVSLDFYVRENSFTQVSDKWRKWIGTRFSPKQLRNPLSIEQEDTRVKRWPLIRDGRHQQRLIKLLLLGADLDPKEPSHVDMVNSWLKFAWQHLIKEPAVLKSDENRYFLPRERMSFSLVESGFICPITNKVLDTTFKGLTPYLPGYIDFLNLKTEQLRSYICEPVSLPRVWELASEQNDEDSATRLSKLREEINNSSTINNLREKNLWTDINDRAVEGGFYYRSVEHSAQQSASNLKSYEELFDQGKVNVMNCSTTMEMGVDIAGISAVIMNNVPPHPANYLQRSGRAGRRKESRALAYTLCKDNPHDKQVFADPLWPFTTNIPAPTVAMNSQRLVQRHVNSMLLSVFLREIIGPTEKERTNLNTLWFYGREAGPSICDRFTAWLDSASLEIDNELKRLTRGTALSEKAPHLLRKECHEEIKKQRERWLRQYDFLVAEEKTAKAKSIYLKRLEIEKSRLSKEYLLRDLASRSFLPNYGFPTDVVSFDNFTLDDYINQKKSKKDVSIKREDNQSYHRGLPSRNLAIAIREYAPGADVILDGRVYRSAGVSLHWQNLASESVEEQKLDIAWRCSSCGQHGYEDNLAAEKELYCRNSNCNALITNDNKRTVLTPAGFVTDAYEDVTNNIQFQKFIPIQKPWVFVGGKTTPLPNPILGDMSYGPDGEVLHHTSGEKSAGFALCLSCGRAESMLGKDKFPPKLSPDSEHIPPRPTKADRDEEGVRLPCSGSGSLQGNITLGVRSFTDVFELVLRNPDTGEYISSHNVALTLAVAARFALSEILGISASEIGYSVRPKRIPGNVSAQVIQLFDVISGGAGFATSAPVYIEQLLRKMYSNLHCIKCENSCSECLLDSETRHDHQSLDRLRALEWLGDNYKNYTNLPDEEKLSLEDSRFAPGSIENVLRRHINMGAEKITLITGGELYDWDLRAPQFRRALLNYEQGDGLEVELIVPDMIENEEIIEDLIELSRRGITVTKLLGEINENIVAQIKNKDSLYTLASRSIQAITPSQLWHQNDSIVIESSKHPEVACEEISFDFIQISEANTKDLSVHDGLDGPLLTFGSRLWNYIGNEVPSVTKALEHEKITKVSYSDRYIQNPAVITILGSFLYTLRDKLVDSCEFKVSTLFKSDKNRGYQSFHDWSNRDDYIEFTSSWLSENLGQKVKLNVFDSNRDIPHHRKLEVEFTNGESITIRFDQGLAYWRVRYGSYEDSRFNFDAEINNSLANMVKTLRSANVEHSERNYGTDLFVSYISASPD